MKKRVVSFVLAVVLVAGLVPVTSTPTALAAWSDVPGIKMVSAGVNHTMAIDGNGGLWAWGTNFSGQLGDGGTTEHKTTPVKVKDGTKFIYVLAVHEYTMAIDEDGGLWAWGNNRYGQHGDGTIDDKTMPVKIKDDTKFLSVSAGINHSMAIDVNGSLWACGANNTCQHGDGTKDSKTTPVKIKDDTKFTSVSVGPWHTMAIDADGNLWGWGDNGGNQLGDGASIWNGILPRPTQPLPIKIKDDTKFTSVSAGWYHTLAIDANGGLWAWGDNSNGQLGDGTGWNETKNTPVKIKDGTKFTCVSTGSHYTMAIDVDGGLWAWGYNNAGQLGDGTKDRKSLPVQIMNGTKFTSVAAGVDHTMAIDVDGGLWAWGDNYCGQLGDGTKVNKNTPVQIWPPKPIDPDPDPTDPNSGIDYESVTDVIVPGSEAGFSINLTQETIATTYTVAAYSIDGGTKWKPVKDALSAAKFPKLFTKDLTLCLSDKALDTAKGPNKGKPLPGAQIVTFPKINKRAATPKLAVNYLIGADVTGATPGDWLLVSKAKGADTTVAVKDGIQIGVADATNKNKTVDAKGFGQFYAGLTNGIPVKPLTGAKVEKTVYFVRTAPQPADATGAYTAASKPVKVTATSENKAPNYKLDYKKETVKLKKGDLYSTDGGVSFTEVTEAKGILLDVSACITSGTAVVIKKAATAKKSASAAQTITPVPRAALSAITLTCANGKLTLDKKYEVYNETSKKWGGAPKVTASGEYDIRLKATAKVAATGTTGDAASVPGKLKVTYGEYAPGKNGVTAAEIVP